jgi:hypothetical protein
VRRDVAIDSAAFQHDMTAPRPVRLGSQGEPDSRLEAVAFLADERTVHIDIEVMR